ncbi:MAG TPA: PAS domain-containing protein [Dongiaceae bacterium]|nr:PAS domain-containing protein [Dongiaceae bacterium]
MVEPKSEALKLLLDYWRRKKGDRVAPARADIDPAEIKPLLPYVGMVDVQRAPLRFRYRLVGTEISQGYGFDLTGRHLDEMDLDDHQIDITREYTRAAESGEPSCSMLEYSRKDGRHIRYERLVLPLSSDGKQIDMLIGGCVFDRAYG